MRFLDSLLNMLNGLGSKDAVTTTDFALEALTRSQLDNAYRGNWIAKKIIKAPAEDATRKWRRWQAGADQIEAIEEVEKNIGIQVKVQSAMIAARLYKASALLIGVADGEGTADQPVNLDRVETDSLKFLHVMNCFELRAGDREEDPMSPLFRKPKWYEVATATASASVAAQNSLAMDFTKRIHPSRVIPFYGEPLLDRTLSVDGWDAESVLQSVFNAIKSAEMSSQGIAALVQDAKVDVINIPGLSAILSKPKEAEALMDRFAIANTAKSNYSTMLLDKNETLIRNQTNFAGLPDVVKMLLILCSAASGIPLSRFVGPGQSGLGGNASGESDTENYHEEVRTTQESEINPALTVFDEILLRSSLGKDDPAIYYEWPPLKEMDEKEKSAIQKQNADTDKIYIDTGLFNEDLMRKVISNRFIEQAQYPGWEKAVEEFGLEPPEPTPEEKQQAARLAAATAPAINAPPKLLTGPKPVGDAEPRSLYVCRMVLNPGEILAWAKSQGIPNLYPAKQLHVTLIYSRQPLDWMKIEAPWNQDKDGTITVPKGGARLVEMMGKCTALLFNSAALAYRNEDFKRAGASSDYPNYQPHISLTSEPLPVGFNLRAVEPYQGVIKLGPELFEEIEGDEWHPSYSADAMPPYAKPRRVRKRKPKAK